MTIRPWRVFVRDIGPTFTFASGERAHERAVQLVGVGGYAEVIVSYPYRIDPITRCVYRHDREPVVEHLSVDGVWVAVERTVTARDLSAGQFVRIESGPKAGQTGTVEHVTLTTQFRTNFLIAIIDMTDGRRVVRLQSDPVTVLRAAP